MLVLLAHHILHVSRIRVKSKCAIHSLARAARVRSLQCSHQNLHVAKIAGGEGGEGYNKPNLLQLGVGWNVVLILGNTGFSNRLACRLDVQLNRTLNSRKWTGYDYALSGHCQQYY
jgi:hypothetical protein